MSKNEKKAPELRFKGFSDDWEQRKLEDDVSMVGGATPSKSNPNYWGGPIEWLSSQEIKEKYVSRGTYTITQKAIDEKTTKIVKSGTPLIVSRSGILARLFPISIPTKDMAINQDIKALIFNEDKINTNFFVAQLQNKEGFILKSIVKTGTTVQSINIPDFSKLELSYPLNEEQKRIGDFFYEIDCAITLHQRKINTLESLKKLYFSMIFPKKNNDTPLLRFKNFEGEWEPRKFKDFIEKSGKKNTKDENYPAYSVSNIHGLVKQSEQFEASRLDNLEKTSYKLVYPGEFAYNPARINVGSIGFNDLEKTVIVSSLYVVLKMNSSLNNAYIQQFIKSQKFINEVRRNTEGSVREYLFFENFKNIKFPYTKIIEEQKKIGLFLKKLDDTLTLHHNKITQLKKIKKIFLRKMFL